MYASSSESTVYNLKLQTRCLSWVPCDEEDDADKQRLLVGTTCLREDNELHLMEYDPSTNKLASKQVFSHPGEMWHLAPCALNPELVSTCFTAAGEHKGVVWRIEGIADGITGAGSDSGGDETGAGGGSDGPDSGAGGAGAGSGAAGDCTMEELMTLPQHESRLASVVWSPHIEGHLLAVHEAGVYRYALDAARTKARDKGTGLVKAGKVGAAAWDPLHANEGVAAVGSGLQGWDLRTFKEGVCISDAHSHTIRDVDYNPNKPRCVATAGDDNLVKFWDLRKSSEAIKVLRGHSHWVWKVKYNRFHDQLVLSGSTDTLVSLWRVSSISSAPLLELDGDAGEKSAADALVKQYEEHEDSVYGVDWSYGSAWLFATLSFSGRVSVCHVPQPEMYKILL